MIRTHVISSYSFIHRFILGFLFVFVSLGLLYIFCVAYFVFVVLSWILFPQGIAWKEHLHYDLFCVEWGVKLYSVINVTDSTQAFNGCQPRSCPATGSLDNLQWRPVRLLTLVYLATEIHLKQSNISTFSSQLVGQEQKDKASGWSLLVGFSASSFFAG